MSEFFEVSKNEGYRIEYNDDYGWFWTYEEYVDPYTNPAVAGEGPFETRDETLCAAAQDWVKNGSPIINPDVELRLFSAQNCILDKEES